MAAGSAIAPRRAAIELVEGVLGGGEAMADLVERDDGPLSGLSAPDRARAQRLALAALRGLSRADSLLKPLFRKNPPNFVRNVLRLAVIEMRQLGEEPHGVVNSAVTMLRDDRRGVKFAGLANAVLRRVAEGEGPEWSSLPDQRLPNWIRGRLSSVHGGKVVARIERAHGVTPPVDLTPKDATEAAMLADTLGGTLLPTGSVRLAAGRQISALAGFDEGRWWVQDAAAALAARALAASPGEAVLDLCAAPGGKTLQLAAAGADVTALDISDRRMARVRENLDRTGLKAEIIIGDALEWEGGAFDAILLDAPCTATGTIRRHPDLPFVKGAEQIKSLVPLQAALLDRAVGWLKPGGRLVYCTCSLFREEGEDQVKAALSRNPGLGVASEFLDLPGIEPDWRGEFGLRLRPDYWSEMGGMDGFFISALRLEGDGK